MVNVSELLALYINLHLHQNNLHFFFASPFCVLRHLSLNINESKLLFLCINLTPNCSVIDSHVLFQMLISCAINKL